MNFIKTVDSHFVGCVVRLITWTETKWKANTQSWFNFVVFLGSLFFVLGNGTLGAYFYNKKQYLLMSIVCYFAVTGSAGLILFVYSSRIKKRMLDKLVLVSNLRKLRIMRIISGVASLYLLCVFVETGIVAFFWYGASLIAFLGIYYIMSARSIIESIPGRDDDGWTPRF